LSDGTGSPVQQQVGTGIQREIESRAQDFIKIEQRVGRCRQRRARHWHRLRVDDVIDKIMQNGKKIGKRLLRIYCPSGVGHRADIFQDFCGDFGGCCAKKALEFVQVRLAFGHDCFEQIDAAGRHKIRDRMFKAPSACRRGDAELRGKLVRDRGGGLGGGRAGKRRLRLLRRQADNAHRCVSARCAFGCNNHELHGAPGRRHGADDIGRRIGSGEDLAHQVQDVSDCINPELLRRGVTDVEQIFRAAAQKSDQGVARRFDARLSRAVERGDARCQRGLQLADAGDDEIS
jgi:hypothetical protein